jgi:iron(III) transport system ATP-binding protein
MTVADHVLFALKHRKRRKDRSEAMGILRSMGLDMLAARHPSELSGGQRQRVALARAIAGNPGTLLMDEPLSSLDAELRVGMRREISSVHDKHGSTVVYVTHDQEEALAMANRVVVMNEGKIEQVGTPSEVYTTPVSPFVARFVSKANLIRGRWEGNFFHPEEAEGVRWNGGFLAASWREQGEYPVRPEQFCLSSEGKGLRAKVESVQYQGREVHCTLRSGGESWRTYWPSSTNIKCGQSVWIDCLE